MYPIILQSWIILSHVWVSLCHVEHRWWGFAWIIDDVVVYIVIVDYVCNVSSALSLSLNSLLCWIQV